MEIPDFYNEYLKSKHQTNRKLIILDLDETLISSHDVEEKDYDFIVCGYIKVKKRPHVDEFLQGLVEMDYDIAVWTAAKHEYAVEVVASLFFNVTKPIHLQFIFTYNKCTQVSIDPINEFEYKVVLLKKLSKIWRHKLYKSKWNKYTTFIIDDNEYTFRKNYGNAIPIPAWKNKEDQKEDQLLRHLLPLLKIWKYHDNVRKIDKRYWYHAYD